MSANAKFNALYFGQTYALYLFVWWLSGSVLVGFLVSLVATPIAWLESYALWGADRRAEREVSR